MLWRDGMGIWTLMGGGFGEEAMENRRGGMRNELIYSPIGSVSR